MKKKTLGTIALALAMGIAGPAYAADDIAVTVNGNPLEFDVAPQIVEGRTMVPMRAIFEEFGMVVDWDGSDRTIFARNGETSIRMQIDNKISTKNGVQVENDVAPMVLDGRTMVPLRFIASALDMTPNWNGETRTVEIVTEDDSYKEYHAWYEVDKGNNRLKVCTNIKSSTLNDAAVYYVVRGSKHDTNGSGEIMPNTNYVSFYAGGYLDPGNNWTGMDCFVFTSMSALQEYYDVLRMNPGISYDEAANKLGSKCLVKLHLSDLIPVASGDEHFFVEELTYRQDINGWGEEYAVTLPNGVDPKGQYYLLQNGNKGSMKYNLYNRLNNYNGKLVAVERLNYFADGMATGEFTVTHVYALENGNSIQLVVETGDKTLIAKAIDNADLHGEYSYRVLL